MFADDDERGAGGHGNDVDDEEEVREAAGDWQLMLVVETA